MLLLWSSPCSNLCHAPKSILVRISFQMCLSPSAGGRRVSGVGSFSLSSPTSKFLVALGVKEFPFKWIGKGNEAARKKWFPLLFPFQSRLLAGGKTQLGASLPGSFYRLNISYSGTDPTETYWSERAWCSLQHIAASYLREGPLHCSPMLAMPCSRTPACRQLQTKMRFNNYRVY